MALLTTTLEAIFIYRDRVALIMLIAWVVISALNLIRNIYNDYRRFKDESFYCYIPTCYKRQRYHSNRIDIHEHHDSEDVE